VVVELPRLVVPHAPQWSDGDPASRCCRVHHCHTSVVSGALPRALAGSRRRFRYGPGSPAAECPRDGLQGFPELCLYGSVLRIRKDPTLETYLRC